MEPSSTWLAERAELRCGEASLASLAEDECPAATLPPDALRNVLSRLDLPSRLAAACVCTEWRDACEFLLCGLVIPGMAWHPLACLLDCVVGSGRLCSKDRATRMLH